MWRIKILSLLLFILAPPALAVHEPDAFGQFYIQTKRMYYALTDTEKEERLRLLGEVEREAEISNSPYTNGALIWVGQVYSTHDRPQDAIRIFKDVLSSQDLSQSLHNITTFELGLAFDRAGKPIESEKVLLPMLNNEDISLSLRTMAAEKIRTKRILEKNWSGAREIAAIELDKGLGEKPILYETIARSHRRTGKYQEAVEYYEKLAAEYPDYRPRNRMIYIDKAAMICKYEGQRERIGYLKEMAQVIEQYVKEATENNDIYAEVYQEYYNLGNSYAIAEKTYKGWGEEMPITAEEALSNALDNYFLAIKGLKKLPYEKRSNIEFEAVVSGSYLSAAHILVQMKKDGMARLLIEEMLQEYQDLSPQRLHTAQRFLTTLLLGTFDPRDIDPLVLAEFTSDPNNLQENIKSSERVKETIGAPSNSTVVNDKKLQNNISSIEHNKIATSTTNSRSSYRTKLYILGFTMVALVIFCFFLWIFKIAKE